MGTNVVTRTWGSQGGCGAITGTITATYKVDSSPYKTHSVKGGSGNVTDKPSFKGCGSFDIIYVAQFKGQLRTDPDHQYICKCLLAVLIKKASPPIRTSISRINLAHRGVMNQISAPCDVSHTENAELYKSLEQAMTTREEALRRVPLFSTLPESELRELADGLLPQNLEQGSLMFREGDKGNDCYFIVDGQVEIIKSMDTPDERMLGVRGAGEAIGEMSLFSDDHQRTASVLAKTPLKLLVMKRNDLESLLKGHPDLAFNLVATLSRRLDESEDHTIADLREKNRQLQQAFRRAQGCTGADRREGATRTRAGSRT